MKHYEGLFILKSAAREESLKETIDKISAEIAAAGGKVETVQKMDKKAFSRVADRKHSSGYYVNILFESEPDAIAKLRHRFVNNEEIFRVLFTLAAAAKPADHPGRRVTRRSFPMANFNKVIIAGNLTRDPELRYTPKGTAVVKFGLAINRSWKSESGENKEEVTFVDVDAWGRQAEVIAQYMRKGRPIFVEGRLNWTTWEDKNSHQKVSKLKVVLETFSFIDSKGPEGAGTGGAPPANRPAARRPSRPAARRRQPAAGARRKTGSAARRGRRSILTHFPAMPRRSPRGRPSNPQHFMAKTEVILIQNIVGLGGESDQVKVAAGYARNYLFPQGLAVPLTPPTRSASNPSRNGAANAKPMNSAPCPSFPRASPISSPSSPSRPARTAKCLAPSPPG